MSSRRGRATFGCSCAPLAAAAAGLLAFSEGLRLATLGPDRSRAAPSDRELPLGRRSGPTDRRALISITFAARLLIRLLAIRWARPSGSRADAHATNVASASRL